MRISWLLSELGVFLCVLCVEKPQQIFHAENAEAFAETGEFKFDLTLKHYLIFKRF